MAVRAPAPVAAELRMVPWHIRAGWLLRAHRLSHSDPGLHGLKGFARVFGTGRGAAGEVSPSALSRWETGQTPVPRAGVRRYETALGIAPYRLVSIIETLARYEGGPAAASFARTERPQTARAEPAARRMDLLLDRVLDDDVLSGNDWDDLTAIATRPGALVGPRRIRQAVSQRLLAETLVSDGIAWQRRFEALSRLMADSLWAPDAIDACEQVAARAEHVGLIDAVCALDTSAHPQAARQVVRQLTDPTNGETFYAALLASIRKYRKRHFSTDQAAVVTEVVSAVLAGGSVRREEAEAAAALLHRLPVPPARAARLAEAACARLPARNIVRYGSLAEPGAAEVGVLRVMARMSDSGGPVPATGVWSDIVDDILHHPVADVRLYTAMLVDASPYGPELAAALTGELRLTSTVQAPERAVPVLHALRVLGGPEQRPAVAQLTLAQGLPHEVVQAAIHAMGHIGGRSPEGYWEAAVHRHAEYWANHAGPEAENELKRLVYSAAMSGGLDALARLAYEHSQTGSLGGFSGWWSGLPPVIRDSARR